MTKQDEPGATTRQPNLTRLARNVSTRRVPIITLLGIVLCVVLSYVLWALVTSFGPYHQGWVQSATTIAAIAFGIVTSLGILLWAVGQSFQHEAQNAREEIDGLSGSRIIAEGDGATVNIYTSSWGQEPGDPSQLIGPDAHESMLRQIYSHGIAQAKLSFFISLIFGSLGSIILLVGAGLAITHASSNGQRYAAVLTQVSGVVINLLAGVFYLQSNRTRKDMGAQGVMLRDDSRSDRHLRAAGLLVDNISDEELRNQTRAQMALQLVEGNATVFTTSDHANSLDAANGTRDQARSKGKPTAS